MRRDLDGWLLILAALGLLVFAMVSFMALEWLDQRRLESILSAPQDLTVCFDPVSEGRVWLRVIPPDELSRDFTLGWGSDGCVHAIPPGSRIVVLEVSAAL